jgi:hypothetical protein
VTTPREDNVSTVPTVPRVEDLKQQLCALTAALRSAYGERSAVIIAVGFPIAGGHDRFAAKVNGPCLTSRGLLAWMTRSVEAQIDETDTSISGKPHP